MIPRLSNGQIDWLNLAGVAYTVLVAVMVVALAIVGAVTVLS